MRLAFAPLDVPQLISKLWKAPNDAFLRGPEFRG